MATDRRVIEAVAAATFILILSFGLAACSSDGVVRGPYVRGIDKYDNKDYRGAIDEYEQALSSNPDDLRIYYNIGLAYQDLARQETNGNKTERATAHRRDAREAFEKVLALDPGNPRAITALAVLTTEEIEGDEGLERALLFLEETEASSDDGEVLPLWTKGVFHQKRAQSVRTSGGDATTHERQAMDAWLRALEIDETHREARSALITALLRKNTPEALDQANELLVEGVQHDQADFTFRLQHARLSLMRAQQGPHATEEEEQEAWDTVERRYELAGALQPRDWQVSYGLAAAAEALGRWQEAVRHLWDARRLISAGEVAFGEDKDLAHWRTDVSRRLLRLYPKLAAEEERGAAAP